VLAPLLVTDEQTLIEAPHVLDVWVSDRRVDIEFRGDFDLSTVADTRQSLALLHRFSAAVWVDLTHVSFIDSHGIEPLVAFDRTRAAAGFPRLHIGNRSRRAQRLLDLTGLAGAPGLDLHAWDLLTAGPEPRLRTAV
jgi:anti-anti-sigma factor